MKIFMATVGVVGILAATAVATVSSQGESRAKNKVQTVPEIETPRPFGQAAFRSEHFTVFAKDIFTARLIAEEAEASLKRICVGLIPDKSDLVLQADIHLWPSRVLYSMNTPHAPVESAGCFLPGEDNTENSRHRIDICHQHDEKTQKPALCEKILSHILPHEVFHLVLWEYFQTSESTEDIWPVALHEGLATMAEKKIDEQKLLLAGTSLACEDVTCEKEHPLARLLQARPADQSMSPAVFYAQSYSFVTFLLTKLSSIQYISFLDQLHKGMDINHALQNALGQRYDDDFMSKLSNDWKEYAILQAHIIQTLKAYNQKNVTSQPPKDQTAKQALSKV